MSCDKSEDNSGLIQTWIIKIDSIGIKQWDKTILTSGQNPFAYGMQTNDGYYVIAAETDADTGGHKSQSTRGGDDYWIIKFRDTTSSLSFFANNNKLCEKFCISFTDQSTNNPTAWQWIFPGCDPSSSALQNPTNICYNNPGVYDVTLITTNAFGNDTLTLNNYITVFATPPFPVITQNGYVLTSSAAASYQWQFNAADIPGATNQSYSVLQSGLYGVVAGDSNGCKNSATHYVLISGVSEMNDDESIFISPNPSDGNFIVGSIRLSASSGLTDCEVTIVVTNTVGSEVFSSEEKITSQDFIKAIDLRALPQGMYLLEMRSGEKFFRKKVVIVR